jgi:hypothetical protein
MPPNFRFYLDLTLGLVGIALTILWLFIASANGWSPVSIIIVVFCFLVGFHFLSDAIESWNETHHR